MKEGIEQNTALSGCKIDFANNYVTKSSSLDYSPRLLKQIEKQAFFSKNFNFKHINAPHIFRINSKGNASFTMERVNGLGWLEYFDRCSINDISKVEEILTSYLKFLRASSNKIECSQIIKSKLISLYPKSKYKKFIKWLLSEYLQEKLYIQSSFCHGDLSFLNILFAKNGLVFIDFLDSFVNSYIIDIIKLRQDIKYGFCLKYSNINSIRISRIFEKINRKLEKNFKNEINSKIFQILEVINFLRIEPYIPKNKIQILNNIIKDIPLYRKFHANTKYN